VPARVPVPGLARVPGLEQVPGLAPVLVLVLALVPVPGQALEQAPARAPGSALWAKYFRTPPQAAGPQGRRIGVNRFGTG
jgi:hypothetical protein